MTLAGIDPFFHPITYMTLPRRKVLEFTTTLGNTVTLRLGNTVPVLVDGRNYGAVLRRVEILECPVQYGPEVMMCAVLPESGEKSKTLREIVEGQLTTLALYPGASVYLIDTLRPLKDPVNGFVIETVRLAP